METQQKLTIERILSKGIEYKATDLHLSVSNPPILRVDDKLQSLDDEPVITPEFMEDFVLSFLSLTDFQKEVLEKERELVLAYSFHRKARFRINIFYQKSYLTASLRIIGVNILPLQKLGLPPAIERFTTLDKGLVIISGPYGSGKTTTLASIINHINQSRKEYILTIEKPIEYVFTNNKSIIEQREVGTDTPTFEKALKAVTHEDVDILAIARLTSGEAVKYALDSAESGKLVFVDLETDSIIKALTKIMSMFPPSEQNRVRARLASNLQGIINQRLLPRAGGGKIVAADIMIPNAPIRAIIQEGTLPQINNIIQTSREEGMVVLDRYLAELVKTGEVLMEDAVKEASDPDQFRLMLRT